MFRYLRKALAPVVGMMFLGSGPIGAQAMPQYPLTTDSLLVKTKALISAYLADYQQADTGVLYLRPLKTKGAWTSPADVKAKKPFPWGYGSGIQDTALNSGHLLDAMLSAYQASGDEDFKSESIRLFKALRYIYSCSPVRGLVPRGPHPDDPKAVYDDSSMDQHTTFIIALALYARSTLATDQDRAFIAQSLQEIGERLESFNFTIRQADGMTQSHVGHSWMGMVHEQVSTLLPTLLALHSGTGNAHWNDLYERYGKEQGGERWELLKPGPHVEINAHPIYADQNAFRVRAQWLLETNADRQSILRQLLVLAARLQMGRDFPGDFFRKLVKCDYAKLGKSCGWNGETLKGCDEAWRLFRPEWYDLPDDTRPMALLAHLRFPLTCTHMVLLSEDPAFIQPKLPMVWEMMEKALPPGKEYAGESGGEVRNLLVINALHLFAFVKRQERIR